MKLKHQLDAKIGLRARNVLDQLAHFLWGFLCLVPVFMIESAALGGMLSALAFALPREFVDQWPVKHWGDTAVDLFFFALGGLTIGNLFL